MNDSTASLKLIAKGAIIFFLALIIGKFITLSIRIITARYLGPEKYGLLSLGFSIASLTTTLILLSLPQAIIRFLPYYKENREKYFTIVPSVIRVILPLSLLASLSLFILAELIAIQIFHSPQLVSVIKVFAIMIPFFAFSQILSAILQALKRTKEVVITNNILLGIIQLILTFLLLYFGYDLFGAAIAYTSAYVAISILFAYFLVKYSDIKLMHNANHCTLRELLIYSTPLILSSVANLAFRQTDIIFISIFGNMSDVGVYSAIYPIAQTIKFIGSSFAFLFIPIISEFHAQNKLLEIKEIYKTTARWSMLLAAPIGAVLIIFPQFVLHIFYGSAYKNGVAILIIFSLTYVIQCILSRGYDLLSAVGETKKIFVATIIGLFSNFVINILLIPKYGGVGAAVAVFISAILSHSLTVYYAYKKFKFTLFSKGIIKSIFAASVSITIIYLIFLKININWYILLLSIIFFLGTYIFLLIILHSFNREDLQLIIALRDKIGIRLYWLENLLKRFI